MDKLITGLTQNTWMQSGDTTISGKRAGMKTPAHGYNKEEHMERTGGTTDESSTHLITLDLRHALERENSWQSSAVGTYGLEL